MRRKEKLMDKKAIEAFISEQNVLRLGLSVDGQPYVVPLNYGYKDGTFYIHCAKEGKKLEMLQANSKVCIEIDGHHELVVGENACQYTMRFTSVIGFGKASILSDKEEVRHGLDILMAQFSDLSFSYNDKALERVVIIKVNMDEMTGKSS